MPKLPKAPDLDRLRSLEPRIRVIEPGTKWHRIYRRSGSHPTRWHEFRYYGPTNARFDHHQLDANGRPHVQDRGITYMAADAATSIAEVFQITRRLERAHGNPWLVQFTLAAPLAVLDLSDTFLVQAGGSMKLSSGARPDARRWSQGFYTAYNNIDGLYYNSSMTNRPIVALYERALAAKAFPKSPDLHRALADPLLTDPLHEACADIGYAFT